MAGDIEVSFEFFPPKTEKMEETLWESIQTLEPLGAALRLGHLWRRRLDPRAHPRHRRADRARDRSIQAAAHLTCVEATREEIDEVAREYWEAGVRHIVALRGDPPEPGKTFAPHPGGYDNAADLVAGLKQVAPFEISVAAYPECHPDSPDAAADLDNLKRKIDAGADRAITQFFFSPETASSASATRPPRRGSTPRSCRASCRSPTSPRPASSRRCAARRIPAWMDRLFEGLDELPAARQLVAATVAAELCAPTLCRAASGISISTR